MKHKAFKFLLLPNTQQEQQLIQLAGISRWIWNYMLQKNKETYNSEKKFIFKYAMHTMLPELKKEHPWLSQMPSQALQQKCSDLDAAIQRVYKQGFGFPKFKSKHVEHHNTFRIPNQSKCIRPTKDRIKLPKLGWVKWVKHRNIEGLLKSVTIKKENNRWWCVCLCEIEEVSPSTALIDSDIIGLDLGIKDFAVCSDGEVIPSNHFYRKAEKQLKRKQKQLSKKQKGSNNYNKKKIELNKQHYRVKCQRQNFTHQASSSIAKNYKLVCIEDLNVAGMKRNRSLAKSISDQGWRQFVSQLEYKIDWVVKIGRFAPSSKTCSCCGNIQDMPLEERTYSCSNCGLEMNRDLNAAMNIKNWGIEKIIGQGSVQIYACGDTSDGDSEQSESSYVSLNQENIPSLEGKRSVL